MIDIGHSKAKLILRLRHSTDLSPYIKKKKVLSFRLCNDKLYLLKNICGKKKYFLYKYDS